VTGWRVTDEFKQVHVLSQGEALVNVLRVMAESGYDKINTPDGGFVLRSFSVRNRDEPLCCWVDLVLLSTTAAAVARGGD
jgi:hypothetical protein